MRIENTSLSQPIQPGLLASNTTRTTGVRGVGFLPNIEFQQPGLRGVGLVPTSLFDSVRNFFGNVLGVKDPDKDAFDLQRQNIWERFAGIVDMKDTYAGGTISREQLQRFIGNVQSIIAEHAALFDQYRSKIDASWINPRFNDYDAFFKKVLATWQQELSDMGYGFGDIPSSIAGMSPTTMLVVGAIAFFLLKK